MFGNHPLPNIVPSLLVFSPPPTQIPPLLPPLPLPLANARTGQATACSSLMPTPAHCTASPAPTTIHRHPPVFAPPLIEGCGQTTCHVTAPSSRRVARCQRRPPTATSPLKQPAYATSQPPTTPTRHLTIQKQRVRHVTDDDDWLKRREEQEKVEEEWRGRMEWEGMNEGERGGRGGEGEAMGARRRRATISEQRGGVNPTRHLVRARLFPPTMGGRLLSRGLDNGAACFPHAALFSRLSFPWCRRGGVQPTCRLVTALFPETK